MAGLADSVKDLDDLLASFAKFQSEGGDAKELRSLLVNLRDRIETFIIDSLKKFVSPNYSKSGEILISMVTGLYDTINACTNGVTLLNIQDTGNPMLVASLVWRLGNFDNLSLLVKFIRELLKR
jgi:hypothetical protein